MDQNERETQSMQASGGDDLPDVLEHRSRARRSPVTMVLAAVVLVALGVFGGLLIGRATNASTQGTTIPPFGNGGGALPSPGGGTGGPGEFPGSADMRFGTIRSVDGDTITVQTPDGDRVTVKIGDNTRIRVMTDGSVSDLGSGDTVVVAGSKDGNSVDATSITESGLAGGFPGPSG